MRLKIYSILFVCIFACMFHAFVSSFKDFLRIFVFQWSAFIASVGLPTALMMIVFSFFIMGLVPFIYDVTLRKREIRSERAIIKRKHFFSYGSFALISSGALFALINIIGAISLNGEAILENRLINPLYLYIGVLYGLGGAIISLFIHGAYKKMKAIKEPDEGYMFFGELAAIASVVLITLALLVWAYAKARATV